MRDIGMWDHDDIMQQAELNRLTQGGDLRLNIWRAKKNLFKKNTKAGRQTLTQHTALDMVTVASKDDPEFDSVLGEWCEANPDCLAMVLGEVASHTQKRERIRNRLLLQLDLPIPGKEPHKIARLYTSFADMLRAQYNTHVNIESTLYMINYEALEPMTAWDALSLDAEAYRLQSLSDAIRMQLEPPTACTRRCWVPNSGVNKINSDKTVSSPTSEDNGHMTKSSGLAARIDAARTVEFEGRQWESDYSVYAESQAMEQGGLTWGKVSLKGFGEDILTGE